ncbi:MAG: radical SAM protein [bacterium]
MKQEEKKRLLSIESKLIDWDFPPQIIIETTSYCNMKCVHCNHRVMKRRPQHMRDDLYKKIIDEIAGTNPDTEVWPTFYGEAFILGEKLFERLRYGRDRGLTNQVLNTNGRLLDRKDWIDKILSSGLKRFILSLDGFTKETFEKIRVGGNRDLIYQAVEKLLERKKELGLEYPVIQCQFSVMEQNKHEVEQFKEYWKARNAEVKTRNMLSWTNSGDVIAPNLDYETDFRIACPWANSTAAIHAIGNLVTCACDYEGGFIAGNLENQTISEIWKGGHYMKIRKIHREHKWDELPDICKNCPDWQAVGAVYYENEKTGVKEGTRPFWDRT